MTYTTQHLIIEMLRYIPNGVTAFLHLLGSINWKWGPGQLGY